MTTPRAPDPRPARTRQALFEALVTLIQEKRWDKIRVQDVLDRTGFGRSTFYAHFDNRFDLLTAGIPDVVLAIPNPDADVPDLLPFFEHVASMLDVLRPLMSQPLLGEVHELFHRQLAASWAHHLGQRNVVPEQTDFVAEVLTGSLMAVSRHWLSTKCERPAAEVSADFERYAVAVVAAADRSR